MFVASEKYRHAGEPLKGQCFERRIQRRQEIDQLALVAFRDKLLKAPAIQLRKIPNNHQPYAVIRKFLENLAR